MAWSMWFMGYGPGDQGVQRTLELASGNASYWEGAAGDAGGGPAGNGAERRGPPRDDGEREGRRAAAAAGGAATTGELSSCPLAAWSAHWLMLSHGVPASPQPALERRCAGAMLPAQYGAEGAALLRRSGVVRLGVGGGGTAAPSSASSSSPSSSSFALDVSSPRSYVSGAPMRLAINRAWDTPPRGLNKGQWKAPAAPLFAVPLNQTSLDDAWRAMARATEWMTAVAPRHIKALREGEGGGGGKKGGRRLEGEGEGEEEGGGRRRRHHAAGLSARLVV